MAVAIPIEREESARTEPFADLTPNEAAEAAQAVMEMTKTRGWEVISEAMGRERGFLLNQLVARTQPREETAAYEAVLGEVRGLDRVPSLIDGIILLGQMAENDG